MSGASRHFDKTQIDDFVDYIASRAAEGGTLQLRSSARRTDGLPSWMISSARSRSGDERIGEVGNRPRVKPQRLGDLRSCHRVAAQLGEQLELDCR